MPNKRASNKVSVGVYIDRELRDMVKKALEKKGLTFTEFVYAAIVDLLNGKADKMIKRYKDNEKSTKRSKKEA